MSHRVRETFQSLESRRLLAATPVARINFQPINAVVPSGYVADVGRAYNSRANGFTYGWNRDMRSQMRDRNLVSNQRDDTLAIVPNGAVWELRLPAGKYAVRLGVGDARYFDSTNEFRVEGSNVLGTRPTSTKRFSQVSVEVNVTDGRLTVGTTTGTVNGKLNYVEVHLIQSLTFDPGAPVAKVNFQPSKCAAPGGYDVDSGSTFGLRNNGLNYGWSSDLSGSVRERNIAADQRYDTNAIMNGAATWELAIPNGKYVVRVVAGDARYIDSVYRMNVEGTLVMSGTPSSGNHFIEGSVEVTVADGRLTLTSASGAVNNKLACVEVYAGGSIQWTSGARSPVNRIESQRAVVDGKLYVIGGYINDWWPQARADVYDPATNAWTTRANLPIGLTHAATVVDGSSIILVGGYTAGPNGTQVFGTKQVLRYDTLTNSYSTLPELPVARGAGGAAIVGRWLHFFSGERSDRTAMPEHWRINLDDLASGWQRRADHPLPITHPATEVIDGKIFCIAGQTIGESQRAEFFLPNSWVYDPATDTWSEIAPLPGARSHLMPSSLVRNGKLIVLGGEYSYNQDLRMVNEYDPQTNTWRDLTPMPNMRASGVAALIGDKLIFTTGKCNGRWTSETWIGTFNG